VASFDCCACLDFGFGVRGSGIGFRVSGFGEGLSVPDLVFSVQGVHDLFGFAGDGAAAILGGGGSWDEGVSEAVS
jgi:hypothetical protein